ncbi:hypothetical protein [Paenibacillus sp. RC67]|uniref:hypothetical protein n=1 Tax=Paenibacillus sp. RC67 TaxID=3039392 RepID=UPI0024AE1FA5|nr:hypothetical protein [Paenibacillus sp. RC67]
MNRIQILKSIDKFTSTYAGFHFNNRFYILLWDNHEIGMTKYNRRSLIVNNNIKLFTAG